MNVEGAYLEVLADTVGSVGVIVAAVLLQVFGWAWVDSVAGVVIGVWILPRAWGLGRRSVRILLQAAPERIDLDDLAGELAAIDGVVERPRSARVDADLRNGRRICAPRHRPRVPMRMRCSTTPASVSPNATGSPTARSRWSRTITRAVIASRW